MCVSLSSFSHFSSHIPGPTGYISHFSPISVFLTIFQVLPCEFLIFLICQFAHHIQGLQCVFLFFHDYQFSRHMPGPTEYIYHFSRFSVLLTIFQIIHCLCIIIHMLQFSHHNTGSRVCISRFSVFSLFLDIFQVI